MRKIELTPEEIKEVIRLYNDELMGSPAIAKKMGYHKTIIIRTLKENGVEMGPSGMRNLGGKKASYHRNKHKHKDKKSKYHKNWRKDNKKHLKEYHTKWRDENREELRKKQAAYERMKCATDPRYRFAKRTRTAVYTCLKEANVSKYRSTFSLLGYSLETLIEHLESQFDDKMTWDNYGEWHVDHIKPMNSFNFKSHEDPAFKECWALENLRPLWGDENLSKGHRDELTIEERIKWMDDNIPELLTDIHFQGPLSITEEFLDECGVPKYL